jgi:hypothetical protein
MSWFATPQSPAAHAAFSSCERLDAKMADLAELMTATAALLDNAEYERVVREHTEATAEARNVREHFEQTADTTPVDGKDVTESVYRRVGELLETALAGLEPISASLQRYANAKAETEYAAGRLTNDIAHAYTLVSVLPEGARSSWSSRLSAAQNRLLEAADKAKDRQWLAALDIVEAAAEDVRGLTAGAKDAVDTRSQEFSGVVEVTNLLAGARARGHETVSLLEQAQKVLSPEGYKVARGRVVKAGQRIQAAQDRLSSVQVTDGNSAEVFSELRNETQDIAAALLSLSGELGDVLTAAAGRN